MDDKVKELYGKLDEGVSRFIDSDTWRDYLKFQARFHRYSFGNALLIWMQCPTASQVAGFNAWKEHGRFVKKGEKALHILAPLTRKVKDEKTGEESYRVFGFKGACVFDVSQTEGAELPQLVTPLDSASDPGRELYNALRQVITIPVSEESDMPGTAKGYYDPGSHRIALRAGLATDQASKTLCHECVHSLLHHKDAEKVSREACECAAEGTAYVVASYFGLDTSEYSFGYVASWSHGEKDFIQTVGSEIQKTASAIIQQVEAVLKGQRQAA